MPMVSKFWLPLEDYVSSTMEELLRGDEDIPVGNAVGTYNALEKPRMDTLRSRYGVVRHKGTRSP
jgi:hypothetical protein